MFKEKVAEGRHDNCFQIWSPHLWGVDQEIMSLNDIGVFGSELRPLPAVLLAVLLHYSFYSTT